MRIQTIITGIVCAVGGVLLAVHPAAAQNFTFTTALTDGTTGSTVITPDTTAHDGVYNGRINTSRSNTYFAFDNGANATASNAGLPGGTSITLTNFNTNAPNAQTGTVSERYSLSLSLTDTGTGQTITQSQTGTVSGSLNSTSDSFNMTFDNTSLTYDFSSFGGGIYTVSFTNPVVAPQPPSGGGIGALSEQVTYAATPEPSSAMLLLPLLIGAGGVVAGRRKGKTADRA